MAEPASPPALPSRRKPKRRGETLFLVFLALLSGALGAGLHLVADVAASTAALTTLTCLSMIVATHALVRRSGTVAALDAEIAELRTEIAVLRGARHAGPRLPSLQPAPGFGEATRLPPLGHGRAPLTTPPPIGRTARTMAPAAAAPALRDTAPPPSARPLESSDRETNLEPKLSASDTSSSAGAAPAKLDWSLRPGTHREPSAIVAGTTAPLVASGPLPVNPPAAVSPLAIEPMPPQSMDRASQPESALAAGSPAPTPITAKSDAAIATQAKAMTAAPDASVSSSPIADALEGLAIPASDGAPRTMPRPETGEWPQAHPKAPTATLDLDTMQNLIEQLAVQLKPHDEIAAAAPEQASEARATAAVAREIAARPAQAPLAQPALTQPLLAVPPVVQPVATTAPALEGAGPRRPMPQPAPYGHLALIAEAVEASRMDVMLDPILALSDRKARHFELSVRLIAQNGATFDEGDLHRTAGGTGLLARLDAAKLASAADVLHNLRTRGSHASLFSAVAGESLADENFASAFEDILAEEEGSETRLILTFSQAEARTFTAAHWRTITDMSEIGLKFAVSDVTDLDMDFETLKRHGFDFIKLDAEVFLKGLPTADGHIPADDICRHLAGLGLGLIVGGIVAEQDLARILGFGAVLGQGTLFGGPRSVELERERQAA